MTLHRVLMTLILMASSCALPKAQELAVRYHSEKSTSPVGEPVFVLAEFTNISSRTVQLDEAPCSQSFRPVVPVVPAKTAKLYGCSGGGSAGSCGSGFVELKPGEKLLRRYLLPDGMEPNAPGDFDYTAERQITFYTNGSLEVVGRQEVRETFTVHAVQANHGKLEADYAPLLEDLQSRDPRRHSLALGAITQHPQEFLEAVILNLSQDPQTISASITGLEKLGTDRAKKRLAELTASAFEESVRQPATTALAELGDTNYCGLMLQLMNLRQGYTSEIAARGAGLLCGEKAIPQLALLLLRQPGDFPPYEIAYALGNTGSRAAVPMLIELLGNSDVGVRRAAKEALYTLTHRQSNSDDSGADRQDWVSWWSLQGKTAQIFTPAECP